MNNYLLNTIPIGRIYRRPLLITILAVCTQFVVNLRHTGISIWRKDQMQRNGDHFVPYRLEIPKAKTSHASSFQLLSHFGEYDVGVLGGGPAGTVMAFLLQTQHNLTVALIDPRASNARTWYPNYGEWRDEWHALADRLHSPGLKECTTNEWEVTDCFLSRDNHDGIGTIDACNQVNTGRMRLTRPYVRVDRVKMQKLLRDQFLAKGGTIIDGKVSGRITMKNLFTKGLVHHPNGTYITLDSGDTLEAKIVVDATGFESRLIIKEDPRIARGHFKELPVGYQIAYGYIADVDNLGPYDNQAMTLFDYRTDFVRSDQSRLKECENKPTFMYVMPLGRNDDGSFRVFMEETSLIGRGERRLTFAECKRRAMQRMEFHKMKLLSTLEEEYCYIPMGGELPDLTQRIIAFGGAANMVHPSTGYQVNRMLAASTDVAQCIAKGLQMRRCPDLIAASTYQQMWSYTNRLQRDFQAFGGEFFMNQNIHILRDFFAAFFSMDKKLWSGFLAGWPGLPNNEYHDSWEKRINFAGRAFFLMSISSRLALLRFLWRHVVNFGSQTVLRSLCPPQLFGNGRQYFEQHLIPHESSAFDNFKSYESHNEIGDVAAKQEAREMIAAFRINQAKQAENGLFSEDHKFSAEKVEENHSDFIFPSPFA